MATDSLTAPAVARSSRLLGFRIPAALVTLVMGVTGLHNLVTGWTDPLDGGAHRLQDLHWGVLEGLLLAVAMGWQLRRPAAHAGLMRVAVSAAIAQLVVMVVGLTPDPFAITIAALIGVALWAHPARREVLRPGLAASPARLVPSLAAAAALLVFAGVQMSRHFSAPTGDVLDAKTGWVGAAVCTLALALVVVVAGLTASRAAAGFAGAGLAVLGVASVLHPHLASSFGVAGGAAALVAAAFVALGARAHRRDVA